MKVEGPSEKQASEEEEEQHQRQQDEKDDKSVTKGKFVIKMACQFVIL